MTISMGIWEYDHGNIIIYQDFSEPDSPNSSKMTNLQVSLMVDRIPGDHWCHHHGAIFFAPSHVGWNPKMRYTI